jgi:methyltransferase (TIGR00027 family)
MAKSETMAASTATDDAIRDVSDTALWVALYRAQESERKDALFNDPFARRLAGERGQRILDTVPKAQSISWPMVVRTQVMDEIILKLVRESGVDTVVNLAAGLDVRPWRLPLPQATHWVDVDLPGMLEHKLTGMANESTNCRYTARAADLRQPGALRAVLDEVAREAKVTLVVTEGLLIYLEASEVAALAREVASHPACRYWLMDLASPMLLKFMEKRWKGPRGLQNAPFKFGPAEGTTFFEPLGWREVEYRSTMAEAKRLNRLPSSAWLWAIFGLFASKKQRKQWERFSGQVLLERA